MGTGDGMSLEDWLKNSPDLQVLNESDEKPQSGMTDLEIAMLGQIEIFCKARNLPLPEQEYKFHHRRKWRFDFAWPKLKIAIEAEGGQWTQGRHQRGQGFADDCEKYNHAAALGWFVYRFTTDQINNGEALAFLIESMPPF